MNERMKQQWLRFWDSWNRTPRPWRDGMEVEAQKWFEQAMQKAWTNGYGNGLMDNEPAAEAVEEKIEYRGFEIVPKRDFGSKPHLMHGRMVGKGYLAVFGPGHEYAGCNALPGATWDETVDGVKRLIDAFIESKGNADRFWKIVHQETKP